MKKKLSVGSIIELAAGVLGFVSFIIYLVGCGIAGFFHGDYVGPTTVCSILGILACFGGVLLRVFSKDNKYLNFAGDLLVALSAILFALSFMYLLSGRIEGLAEIYGSNEDVKKTMQTPENLSSASHAIVGMVFFAISMLVATVASFFPVSRKDAETAAA